MIYKKKARRQGGLPKMTPNCNYFKIRIVTSRQLGIQYYQDHQVPVIHLVIFGRFFARADRGHKTHWASVAHHHQRRGNIRDTIASPLRAFKRSSKNYFIHPPLPPYALPSRTKCSDLSVRRSAITCALRASGNTLGQFLKARFVVMLVDRL